MRVMKLIILLLIVVHDNIKKAHAKLADNAIPINKVHIENNNATNASNISKKNT